MIGGEVNADREAIIRVAIRGPDESELEADFVIDTGFTDYMTLPTNLITKLELPHRETANFTLADGSQATLNLYRLDVLWDGTWRGALAAAASGSPLIGMALLEGFHLAADIMRGGAVSITRIDR